ncbi:MAG: hypothetical protein HC933_01305 [Pleurocapsa sp. SU_196_0]|nr:hypothetical protein [Pleurocapsa sp. SU_196_0]
MKHLGILAAMVALAACTQGSGGGTATYRVEFSGSLNQNSSFSGVYATQSGQGEVFATTLPASKEFTAGASDYVLADGTVVGNGGTITVKAFKNNALCEEKTLAITATGKVSAACNKP